MLPTLEKYHKDGLLHKQTHPTLDLTIWNYSPKVQYERLWDDVTIMCRGLVTNSKGEIIARPFKKFFNYEEHKPEDLPNEQFEVYEKMDGSLGILFYYETELSDEKRYNIWFNNNYETGMERFFDPNNLPDFDDPYYEPTPKTKGEWIISTRGSFTSPQSIFAKYLLDTKYNLVQLLENYTYLLEIIYPENRIVCDYGDDEKLVLLGIIETKTGEELPYDVLCNESDVTGFPLVTLYKTWGEGYDILKEEISKDKEGYVIRFKNGFRMKIKGEEYVRLHRILTNVSNRDIWEYLKDNKPLDELLEKVPDEFNNWVKETVSDLQNKFDTIKNNIENDFKELIDKKEFAEKIKDNPNKSFLFKRLNSYSNQLNEMIWNSIYPTHSKPFKKDEI
jgi:RNA ligase